MDHLDHSGEQQQQVKAIWHYYLTTGEMPKGLGAPWFMTRALLEKLIGDEVAGFFVPGFAGADHARVAVEAGEEILRATGHGEAGGPWVPVGVGVHTGLAYVGAGGAGGGVPDITVLGDAVNTASR